MFGGNLAGGHQLRAVAVVAQRQNCRELAKKQEIGMICIRDNLQSETMVFPINFVGVLQGFP